MAASDSPARNAAKESEDAKDAVFLQTPTNAQNADSSGPETAEQKTSKTY